MAYNPLNPNGQATMANSQPVVLASNQSSILTATSIIGTVPVTQSGINITSVSGIVNIAGSVAAVQNTNPWIITGSVQASLTPAANQSVSGTVGASIIGLTPVNITNLPTTQNVSGSVVGFQGTNPWIITGSVQASLTPAANQSVSGTVTTNQGTNPWIITGSVQGNFSASGNQSVSGTVVTTQGTSPWIITGSVQGSFSPSGNQSVSGTVRASVIGLTPINITQVGGTAISLNTGTTDGGTQRVVQATGSSFNTSVLTVGTTVTSIIGSNANRIKITLINNGTNPVYIGARGDLNTGNGQYMAGIAGYPVTIRSNASIFGIASGSAQAISLLEEVK